MVPRRRGLRAGPAGTGGVRHPAEGRVPLRQRQAGRAPAARPARAHRVPARHDVAVPGRGARPRGWRRPRGGYRRPARHRRAGAVPRRGLHADALAARPGARWGAVTRSRATLTLYAALGCLGYLLNGLGAVLPELRDELALSRAEVALYPSGFALGLLAVGSVGDRLANLLGRR